MLDHCTKCGNGLKNECPKEGKRDPCQECVNEKGERECRRCGPRRNVCLCCNREYMNELYPVVKAHRAHKKEIDHLQPLEIGPLVFDDASGDIIVRWEPRTKGEEAYYAGQDEVKAIHEWVTLAMARRPKKGRYALTANGKSSTLLTHAQA